MKYINWLWGILVAALGIFIFKFRNQSDDKIIADTQAKIDGFKVEIHKNLEDEKAAIAHAEELKKQNEGKTDEELADYFNSHKSDQ